MELVNFKGKFKIIIPYTCLRCKQGCHKINGKIGQEKGCGDGVVFGCMIR